MPDPSRGAPRHDPGDLRPGQTTPANRLADPGGRRRGLSIIAAGIVGAVGSLLLAVSLDRADARADQARFAELAREDEQAIADSLQRVSDAVRLMQSYFEASKSEVTRSEFARFSGSLRQTLGSGLREVVWAPLVTAPERDTFEQEVRADGYPTFAILERNKAGEMIRAGERADYMPILYVDPITVSPRLKGFDLGSEEMRRSALTRARETGQPAATPVVRLNLITTANSSGGYLTIAPVIGGAGASSFTLRGFTAILVETGALVEAVMKGKSATDDVDLYFFDPDITDGDKLIYWHPSRGRPATNAPPTEAAIRAGPHIEVSLKVADQHWGLLIASSVLSEHHFGNGPKAALLTGLIITLTVIAYLTQTLRHALRLEAVTARLRITGEDLRAKAQEVEHLARHDTLTGLPNRATFQQRLVEALQTSQMPGEPCVMMLDLDRFKSINDTFGHGAGDRLLESASRRLSGNLRAEDTAARMGGDEFAILLRTNDPAHAEAVARRLVASIAEPYVIDGYQMTVGLSVGIAFPADGSRDADLQMRNADLALYQAKAAGRGTWSFFSADMQAAANARRAMEASLRTALAEDAFHLNFQPIIRLSDRHVSAFEALLRWNCPGVGPVSPAIFVPLAEECGLIVAIGDWVLHAACREAAGWRDPVRIAVNISAAQFVSPTLIASVKSALDTSGLAPARLELEVTETLLLQDSRELLSTLHALKTLGISISMDDFGTGYSSLSYLTKFPFDTLKIDQSFVRDLPDRPHCRAVVHAVAGLCRSLGIITIAEGVETEEQLRGVIDEGCDEVQGYLFSRPLTAAKAAELLANGEHFAAA
jgi:diguanylate cyclase (GGDEF)-like protein